jgi:hypothetical protein
MLQMDVYGLLIYRYIDPRKLGWGYEMSLYIRTIPALPSRSFLNSVNSGSVFFFGCFL